MRVFQLMPTIAMGDAVSNDAVAVGKVLRSMGYDTEIYADSIDKRLPSGTARSFDKFPRITSNDTIIYHLSTGSAMTYVLNNYKCRKGIIYHNITPSYFYRPYNGEMVETLEYGRNSIAQLADKVDFCLADSEYNMRELRELGYKCSISVRPVLIPFTDYAQRPDDTIIKQYDNDGFVNFLFVGRIAPNKKHEDIIKIFYTYHKYCNPKSRLIFVGSWNETELYYRRLLRYVDALGLDNVVFTGHITFRQLLAYYQIADMFICMSEHEGFCVPLVEAMYFGVPVMAYNAAAVPDTLGGTGILLNDKDPFEAALMADRVLTDTALRREIISEQRRRQQDFSYNAVKSQLEEQLRAVIG